MFDAIINQLKSQKVPLQNLQSIKKFLSKFENNCDKYYANYIKCGNNSMSLVQDILEDVGEQMNGNDGVNSDTAYQIRDFIRQTLNTNPELKNQVGDYHKIMEDVFKCLDDIKDNKNVNDSEMSAKLCDIASKTLTQMDKTDEIISSLNTTDSVSEPVDSSVKPVDSSVSEETKDNNDQQ